MNTSLANFKADVSESNILADLGGEAERRLGAAEVHAAGAAAAVADHDALDLQENSLYKLAANHSNPEL